jgi:hypothetical protein
MAGQLYPHATHIADIYHAREHLHELAGHLAFITPGPSRWLHDRLDDPGAGNIEAIIDAARQYPLEGVLAGELDKKLCYFESNAHRMRYARYRDLGMFTGSGAIEAACKQIPVAQRAKQSGIHWTVEGAADIIALPASQRPMGRTLDRRRSRPPSRAAGSHLTDSTTQTPRQQPPARSSPTNLSCTPGNSKASRTSDRRRKVADRDQAG